MLDIINIPMCKIFIKDNFDYCLKIKDIFLNLSSNNTLFWFYTILNNYSIFTTESKESDDFCKRIDISKLKIKYHIKNLKYYFLIKSINYYNYSFVMNKIVLLQLNFKNNIFKNNLIFFK